MKTAELSWKAFDGIKIYGKYWSPDDNIKAVVCIVHGMGEHVNRFEHVAEFLVSNGYGVIGYDQRGHGKSEGKRGHAPSLAHLLNGVEELLHKASEYFPGKPKVLFGHSMGGNVVANYVLKQKPLIAGVILSSPWFKLAFDPPASQVKLAKMVVGFLPAFTQSTKLDASAISRIPAEVEKYKNDKLVHDKISTTMFLTIHDQGLWALKHAENWHLPLLIYHGTGDRLTSAEASKEFAKSVGDYATLKIYEGAYHEMHNDLNREELFALIKDWLDTNIKAR